MQTQVLTGVQTVFPVLRYKDADAAMRWLRRAFGAEEHSVVRNEDGAIIHAELGLGTGIVMLGTAQDDILNTKTPLELNAATQLNYVVLDDTDAHCERAKAAGAEIVVDLHTTHYGSRDYIARDHEGNVWCFGTYSPFKRDQPA